MKCPACSAELPDTAKFCAECGHKFAVAPAPDSVRIRRMPE